MGTYYTLLGVEPGASQEAIEAAYGRQRDRYNPERVAELDPELHKVAAERSAELERAYAILANPERRRQYDASLSGAGAGAASRVAAERRSLTARERTFAIVGAVAAVALIAIIWVLTGRNAEPQSQAMGEVNRPAPAFTVPALAGGTVSLADYKGKVVLLNFWGTWCEPCKRELPALQAAHRDLADAGLAVIGVNLTDDEQIQGRDQAAIKAYLEQYGVTYPVALDVQGDVTNAYRVFPLPTSFFIDGDGRIRYVHIGELTLDDVQARFTELKGEASALRAP
ncbi:MAG: redoxin domain-containing protein [Chloroflexales bacterium]|nr:redoxin domain-containing protein [Chloroflexales bacterium]